MRLGCAFISKCPRLAKRTLKARKAFGPEVLDPTVSLGSHVAVQSGPLAVLQDAFCLTKLLCHLDFELVLVVLNLIVKLLLVSFDLAAEAFDVLAGFSISERQVGCSNADRGCCLFRVETVVVTKRHAILAGLDLVEL